MDSNNFSNSCGLGEREGRVYSRLVAKRNYGLSHGIGRSGDIAELQPKAVGSSILNKLTNELLLDVLKISGLSHIKKCALLPMATGMTLTFCMLSIRELKPQAKYVIMPRIDQKSCIKSILAAGYTPIIIENEIVGDELQTDLKLMEEQLTQLDKNEIACVFSTTSCFAPRGSDRIEEIAKLCQTHDIFHIVNNAYGLQSSKCSHMLNLSARVGRVDVVVQSTDKNMMVPVGGAIIAAFSEDIIERICQFYPGRASSSQSLDMLITMLTMGSDKYRALLKERKECFQYLKSELEKLSSKFDERVLETPHNSVSIGISLDTFGDNKRGLTQIGSMLFTRYVCGVRVVTPGDDKVFGDVVFKNFNMHSIRYPHSYLTAAAAIGIKTSDVDCFIKRLNKVLEEVKSGKLENVE